MKNLKTGRPSPAIVIAVVALVAALAGTAVAGPTATTSISKKSVKKTAKKEASKYFDANIGAASVANAENAASADSASQLGGQSPSAFRTGAASVRSSNSTFPNLNDGSTVLSTTITLPSTKTVTAFGTVRTSLDAAINTSIDCNARIAGVDGVDSGVDLSDSANVEHATIPVTQSRTLGAGTHTVVVRCTQLDFETVEVNDRALSVVATG